MGLTLEQAIARVPFLKDAKDIKTTELKGGITNLNYKIESGGKAYVLRVTGETTGLLGIKRDVEYASNKAAGELGIAPEVKGEFNVFRRVEHLIKISKEHNSKFPFDFDWILQMMHGVEEALLKDPYVPTPCHCDLLNLNFLDEETPGEIGEIRLLDWEYAGMGDIFFDLGNFCHHHRFSDELVQVLLQEYFGEVTPKVFAHLKLMWPMSTIHEAMWGTTQTGISTLDEDFQGYADLWFARTREAMIDPRWPQWLKDVAKK